MRLQTWIDKGTLLPILLVFQNVLKCPEHLEFAGTQLCRLRMHMLERSVDHLDIVQKQMLTLPNQDQLVNSVGWVI